MTNLASSLADEGRMNVLLGRSAGVGILGCSCSWFGSVFFDDGAEARVRMLAGVYIFK